MNRPNRAYSDKKSWQIPTFALTLTLGMIFVVIMLSGCTDILTKNIADEKLIVSGPAHQLETDRQTITFWWEPLDIEDVNYEIEIVHPSFAAPEDLIHRENIEQETAVSYTLNPNKYQWRVTAFQDADYIRSAIFDLNIALDSTLSLVDQTINILKPENQFVTNLQELTFLWEELFGAEAYKVQVASPDFTNSTYFVADELVEGDFINVTDLQEGEYIWRVRAENDISVSSYSTAGFTIDLSAPVAPILLLPIHSDSIALPSNLSWQSDADVVKDSVFVFQDSLLTMPVLIEAATTSEILVSTLPPNQTYYWLVKSIDHAGNESVDSEIGRFFVKE